MPGLVQKHRNAGGLGDLEDALKAFVAPGRVYHCGLRRERCGEIIDRRRDDQFGPGEPYAAIPGCAWTKKATSPFMPVVSGNW